MRTLLLFALLFAAHPLSAQPDTELFRQSLQRIEAFYLTVDLEGSRALTEHDALDVSAIRQNVASRLAEAGLRIIEPTEGIDTQRVPNLYIHVNLLDAGQGLVPFAVNTQFFQEALLPESRIPTIACTWDTGLVGLVSYDTLSLIGETAVSSVTNFIDDYRAVNP
jgi:hypothetical protein